MLTLPSCEVETASPAPPVTNPPEATGNIPVKVTTVGGDDDPDGYTVTVQGVAPVEVVPNGETSFNGQRVGRYQVELSGIAGHCTGTGTMVREVNVTANGTATVEFEVGCSAILRDRIVYAKGRGQNFSDWKIYSSKLDASDLRVILEGLFTNPTLGKDNTVYFFRSFSGRINDFEIWQVNLDGTGEAKVMDRTGFALGTSLRSFKISSDKSEFIVYGVVGSGTVFSRTGINGTVQPLVFSEASVRVNPVWSPVTRE